MEPPSIAISRRFIRAITRWSLCQQVCNYILDPRKILEEDLLYRKSLVVEPRTARLSVSSIPPPAPQSLPKGGPSLSRGQTLS